MRCQIKDGKYYAPNGEESKLHADLKNQVGEEQAQSLFVLAYTPQFIREVRQPLIYNYKSKLPQNLDNVRINEIKKGKNTTLQVEEKGEVKGSLALQEFKDGYKIKSVIVSEQERGKGYGKALYVQTTKKAIDEGVKIYSDQIRTEGGDAMWEYLSDAGFTSENKKVIMPTPSTMFDSNGEIGATSVIQYATGLNEQTEPLSFVEQQEVRNFMSGFPDITDSEELLGELTHGFYENGMFSPNKNKLKKLYSTYEIANMISDLNVLKKVKTSIEKLKRTPNILNTTVVEATYRTTELDSFGKLKVENPYKITQDIIETYGGIENADLSEAKDGNITQEMLDQFKRIPATTENGELIIEEIIYPSATKVVEDRKILNAVDALIEAPAVVDTKQLEDKLSGWLLNYGINIQGFNKTLLPSLRDFLRKPTAANTELFSNAYREDFNVPIKAREYVTKINNKGRDLVYMDTNKSEQQLFDEMSLLQSEVPNVYHRVEKVELSDLKKVLQLADDVSELQAYKIYFDYVVSPVKDVKDVVSIPLTNSIDYLTNEFIADFNIAKLKNPEDGLYNKFKITEKGIEQIYFDPISVAEIEAHLAEESPFNTAFREYSVLSKQTDNFIVEEESVSNKSTDKVEAINNFQKVKKAEGEVNRVTPEIITVKNEVNEFLNVENDLYELVDKKGSESVYSKIEKNTNLNYNELFPTDTYQNNVKIKTILTPKIEFNKVEKLWKPQEIQGMFDC